MVRDFRHKGLERFFRVGSKAGILPQHAGRLRILLTALEYAQQPQDMDAPGFRLHRLSGKYASYYAVSISGNWRLIFQFDGQDAVKVDYLDYH